MGISTPIAPRSEIIYPDSDGKPMADNTLQFQWIVTIKEGLEHVFHEDATVFVAGDLLWYPAEGHPKIRQAPDALVAFGRPKGYRGSYKQWEEGGIAPQVVFEVLSPGNRAGKLSKKFKFYEEYGVEEYYIYDPDRVKLTGYLRGGGKLEKIAEIDGWTSPRLGVRFDLSGPELVIYGPDGRRFLAYQELAQQNDQLAQQNDQLAQQNDQLAQQNDQLAQERDAERRRTERMIAKLRELGLEPPE
jgi:Uma2 family endonuclease